MAIQIAAIFAVAFFLALQVARSVGTPRLMEIVLVVELVLVVGRQGVRDEDDDDSQGG